MYAGMDFGSALVKAAWEAQGKVVFASQYATPLEDILRQMRYAGVDQVTAYGRCKIPALPGFAVTSSTQKAPLLVRGVQEMLSLASYTLVDVGTTTDAYRVHAPAYEAVARLHDGGGILWAVSRSTGAGRFWRMPEQEAKVTQERMVEYGKQKTADALFDFGRMEPQQEPLSASMRQCAAAIVGALPESEHVVFTGTSIQHYGPFRQMLELLTHMRGMKPHLDRDLESALALGALRQTWPKE